MDWTGQNGGISRTLEQGWDYQPSWRNAVVEQYLVEKSEVKDPLQALSEEEDPYVRQFYLVRRTGKCMHREAFLWAYRCHSSNRTTGAGSLIKAMCVARFPVKEIAARLRTTTKSVVIFLRLFFDIERYIDDRNWLSSIVFRISDRKPDLAELREQR